MNSTHTWSCWQDFICGKNGLQCVFLATFFSLAVLRIAGGYKYISNKVYHSRLYTLYLFLDMTTHGSRLLPRPRPGQDGLRSMFNSRQSFVDCVSAGAGRHYLCLQSPGEAAAAARRDHCWLLTSWILPRWLPLSQYCHQQFSHSKSLRRKILVPIILTVKKISL